MIEDVKTYSNTVGSRLTKRHSTRCFGQEKETEFCRHIAELASQEIIPHFKTIAFSLSVKERKLFLQAVQLHDIDYLCYGINSNIKTEKIL
jgi:hypothetical protein